VDGNLWVEYMSSCSEGGWRARRERRGRPESLRSEDLSGLEHRDAKSAEPQRVMVVGEQLVNLFGLSSIRLKWVVRIWLRTRPVRGRNAHVGQERLATVF
jgi:hypothetical protein